MADLEQRVDKLEEKVRQLEIDINKSLSDIKTSLSEIKASLKESASSGDLKNDLIEKDVKSNTERIRALESNQSRIVWIIITEVVAVIIAGIKYYLSVGGIQLNIEEHSLAFEMLAEIKRSNKRWFIIAIIELIIIISMVASYFIYESQYSYELTDSIEQTIEDTEMSNSIINQDIGEQNESYTNKKKNIQENKDK